MDVNDSLFQAVRDGNLALAKEMINTYGLSYSKAWAMGYVLLRISTKNKHFEITKLLLESGAKVNNSHNRRKKFNDTPLHYAAISGELEIAKMLLDKGANIHAKNEYGATALQTAVFRNKLNIVELLLNRGASVNEKKSDGSTSLHTAIQRGNLKAVEMLLKYKVNVNSVSNSYRRDGQTPLHFAAERGNERIIELLLKNGAIIDAKAKGLTPVYFATLHGKDKVVKKLLDHGANVDAQDTSGKTILHLAVELGNLKMVDHILKHGPDLNNKMNSSSLNKAICGAKGKYKLIIDKLLKYGFTYDPDQKLLQTAIEKGYTQIVENCLKNSSNAKSFLNNLPKKSYSLLHAAVQKKQYEITEMLIKYGADVNVVDGKDKSPMYYATENGDIKMLKLLLANEASVKNCSGLLINAVKKENIEMVQLLLKHKVNVKEVDVFGRTALHYSALNELDDCLDSVLCMQLIKKFIKSGKEQATAVKGEIAKILLAAGADVNTKAKDGRSPLHCACFKGYYNVVQVLFEYNAKMFADETGALPMHLGAYSGNVDILKMLINKGADVNAKTNDGWTAVHFATHEVQTEFLEYLLNNGAKIDEKEAEHGSTALHIAAKNDYLDFVELLLNYGADIDSTDDRGRTALNIATKEGNNRIVRALLEYGCDIKNQSKKSFTPFESAMMLGVDIFEGLFNHFGSDDDDDDDDDYYGSDYDCFDCDSDYNAYYGSENDYYDSDADYFDSGRNIFSSNQITEMLQHHVIMMKAANLPVKEDNLATNGTSSKLSEFKIKCEQEVEKLKSEKICANTNVTFYDILSKPIDNVAIYARNPKIVEVLKTNDYKQKFTTYSGLINGKIMRAITRKDLLDKGYVFFDLLSDSLSIRLPYNCTENICSYLGDKELRILIDASKPSK